MVDQQHGLDGTKVMLVVIRDGLILQSARLYGDASDAELANQNVLDASKHGVVRPHNGAENVLTLIRVEAERGSNLTDSAAPALL